MITPRKKLVFAVLAALLVGGVYVSYRRRAPTARLLTERSGTWLSGPRKTAALMTERYGPPNSLAGDTATWRNRSPWKRIVVHGRAPEGWLEQTVSYGVPASAIAPLGEFGRGVRVDLMRDELTASSGDEALNRLALNLAVEIVDGRRGAAEARDFYDKTARLASSGKSSSYLAKLLFTPYRPLREDPRRRGVGY